MGSPVAIRFIEQKDVQAVADIEAQAHARVDEDFGDDVESYAWGRDDIYESVRQYRSSERGRNDTRLLVAETMVPCTGVDGLRGEKPAVCGAFAYEIQADGYELLLFTAAPWAPPEARKAMLDYMLAKVGTSENRRKLSIVVPDGDYATLKFFMDAGWQREFKYNPQGNDAWLCRLELAEDAAILTS